ncbi:MAG: SDR family oxidoreductase [Nitrospirota bacterium]|nr:MAG: SDR family oxidoreductase [Nitrospirota bacterium]
MSSKLQRKVAVITGGNSGIGLASAKLFQAEGARVIITGRRKDAVEEAVKEIGGACKGIVSDTGNLNDIVNLYEQIQQSGFRIDVLFLNAGIAIFGPFDTMNEATFDAMVNVNFKGLFFNIQKAAPLLNEGASVIINSSIADQKGFPNTNIYAATKAAVRSLARTLSTEFIERKIRVNSLAPGPIDTPIFDKVGIPTEQVPDMKESFAGENPMKRLGTSEEIAKAALFLASDDSSYITGIDLTVDGGVTQL